MAANRSSPPTSPCQYARACGERVLCCCRWSSCAGMGDSCAAGGPWPGSASRCWGMSDLWTYDAYPFFPSVCACVLCLQILMAAAGPIHTKGLEETIGCLIHCAARHARVAAPCTIRFLAHGRRVTCASLSCDGVPANEAAQLELAATAAAPPNWPAWRCAGRSCWRN